MIIPIRDGVGRESSEQRISNRNPGDSKKDFEVEQKSKKDFESPPANSKIETKPEGTIEFDCDTSEGRWRFDWQVAELVIYRNEFGLWPSDVPVETGLRSYYELRYFDEGTNRKGERYAELYAKHRAKRDLWIKQADPSVAMDIAAAESNVVPLRKRTSNSN